MKSQRWLRILPVAFIMYTISYIDRTNVSLALDPTISGMMRDLRMDDRMKGEAAGIFFIGYLLLQVPGGYLASHWSARKFVAALLVLWGACAIACGLSSSFRQFEVTRFLLGVAESGVYPAVLVLLAHWFPRGERARANAFWNLCMPFSVAASAPLTGWMLGQWGWQTMLMIEGALPFLWLPIWLYIVRDHPRDAKWISAGEREHLETTLEQEAVEQESAQPEPIWRAFLKPTVLLMLLIYFLQNSAIYGLMTFLTEGLKSTGSKPTGLQFGILFSIPYLVTIVLMILWSRNSDRTGDRRGHVAAAYIMSGVSLIASVLVKEHSFWLSYALLCFAVPGPFVALAPFWAIPSETLPRRVMGPVMGLINAIGNLGGYLGPYIVGSLKESTHSVIIPFSVLGIGLLIGAGLCTQLPAAVPRKA
jgi:sugar phosphate permease